jgi:hypothetical protein
VQRNLTLEWADGEYDFRLSWAGCAEIERKADAGIQQVYERVMVGHAHLTDVAEIIRQALLGGAGGTVDEQAAEMKPPVVEALIRRYVTGDDARPFTESWTLASTILHTFMQGYEPANAKGDVKKKPNEAQTSAST